MMGIAESAGLSSVLGPEQREANVRTWIARKESVCPYAPGLARFVHLPEIKTFRIEHVHYLARELKAFYDAKESGARVGRWMLMPSREWESHEEAHAYSEQIFWLLNAAYFHLFRDKKSLQAAMNRALKGYNRGHYGEILNPIVGKFPSPNANVVPAKSLFCSALSPLYNSQRFYRYCPHSIIPLVYASEFQELKLKHPNVTESVTFEMACSGLFEVFGDDLSLNLDDFREELPFWGAIVDRTAETMRAINLGVAVSSPEAKGCSEGNLTYFRASEAKLVAVIYSKLKGKLCILNRIASQMQTTPKQIINAAFAGSGLYNIPDYLPKDHFTSSQIVQ